MSLAGAMHRPVPAWHWVHRPWHRLSQHTPSTHCPVAQGVPLTWHVAPCGSTHCPFTNVCPLGHPQVPLMHVRPPVQSSQQALFAMQRPPPQSLLPSAHAQTPPLQARFVPAHWVAFTHCLHRLSEESQLGSAAGQSGVAGQQAFARFWTHRPPPQSSWRWVVPGCSGQPHESPSMHT